MYLVCGWWVESGEWWVLDGWWLGWNETDYIWVVSGVGLKVWGGVKGGCRVIEEIRDRGRVSGYVRYGVGV